MLKVGVRHALKDALELFSREVAPMALMSAPAITGRPGGGPRCASRGGCAWCSVPKSQLSASIDMGTQAMPQLAGGRWTWPRRSPSAARRPRPRLSSASKRTVPLVQLAWVAAATRATRPTSASSRAGLSSCPTSAKRHHRRAGGALVRAPTAARSGATTCRACRHPNSSPCSRPSGGGGIASVRMDSQGKAAQMRVDHPFSILASTWPSDTCPPRRLASWHSQRKTPHELRHCPPAARPPLQDLVAGARHPGSTRGVTAQYPRSYIL